MRLKVQWPLVLFSLIAGIGACLFLFAVLPFALGAGETAHMLAAIVLSMVIVVVGGFCSVFHLARLQNSWHVIKNIFSLSGISLEILLLGVMLVVEFVCAVLIGTGSAGTGLRVMCWIGIILALLLSFFCGHGYVMPGRPEWDTNLLPCAYLTTSLAAAGFLSIVLRAAFGQPVVGLHAVGTAVCLAALLCALLCLLYGVHVRTAVFDAASVAVATEADIERKEDEERTAKAKTIFIAGLIVCGVALVLVCGLLVFALVLAPAVIAVAALGAIAAIVAGVSVRTLMWEVGRCYLPLFDLSDVGITV